MGGRGAGSATSGRTVAASAGSNTLTVSGNSGVIGSEYTDNKAAAAAIDRYNLDDTAAVEIKYAYETAAENLDRYEFFESHPDLQWASADSTVKIAEDHLRWANQYIDIAAYAGNLSTSAANTIRNEINTLYGVPASIRNYDNRK